MKRRSLLSGSRNRNVPASSCAQSDPNALADMQSTSTRERSRPSSILAGMLSPGLTSQSSYHTLSPSDRSRSASALTISLSLWLWLRKTSNANSGMGIQLRQMTTTATRHGFTLGQIRANILPRFAFVQPFG